MSQAIIRLGPRHKKLLYAGFALLWTSGALWLAFHYFLRVEGDFGPEAHPKAISTPKPIRSKLGGCACMA